MRIRNPGSHGRLLAWLAGLAATLVGLGSQPATTRAVELRTCTARVVDAGSKQPIVGVRVGVERFRNNDPQTGKRQTLRVTDHTTDAAGSYQFTLSVEDLAEPRLGIVLHLRHPDHPPDDTPFHDIQNALRNQGLGDRLSFDTEVEPGAAVLGVVVGPDGQPVAGVAVRVASWFAPAAKPGHMVATCGEDVRTDDGGRFRSVVRTPGTVELKFASDRFALLTETVAEGRRGDLGRFVLRDGLPIAGRVLDDAGKPLAGVPVRAYRVPKQAAETEKGGFWDESWTDFERWAITNATGDFRIPPVPPGDYKVVPTEQGRDLFLGTILQRLPVPFAPVAVTLEADKPQPPVEIRPMPHVSVEVRCFDSKHRPAASPFLQLGGRVGEKPRLVAPALLEPMDRGVHWLGWGWSDESGIVLFHVPNGLTYATIGLTSFLSDEHRVYRYRLGPDLPWSGDHDIDLDGLLQRSGLHRDRRGIEVMAYDAPTILATVTARDGSKLGGVRVSAAYVKFAVRDQGESYSALNFAAQADGRFRSKRLLPDEPLTVTATADGFKPQAETLSLPEGAVRELKIILDR